MRVTDLTPDHVGRQIALTAETWFLRGTLEALHTYHDYIEEKTISEPEPEHVLGAKWVVVTVSGWERAVNNAWEVNVGMLE